MAGPIKTAPDANRIWSTALGYARRDIPVLPVDPGSKAPLTKGGVYDASTDLRQLSHWWRDLGHQAGLAVPTGQRSGIDALDVDPRHGGDLNLARLIGDHGNLPLTTWQHTQSGGRHYFFRHDPTNRLLSRASAGLDCRTTGAYVLVPPSPGYRWGEGKGGLQNGLAPWPGWLVTRFQEQERTVLQSSLNLDDLSSSKRELLAARAGGILSDVLARIRNAPPGEQEFNLSSGAMRLGQWASTGLLDEAQTRRELISAGLAMENESGRRPWTAKDVNYKVDRSFSRGLENGDPKDLYPKSYDRQRERER